MTLNASNIPTSEKQPKDLATVGAAVGSATVGVGAAVTATLASVCCTGPVIAPIVVGLLGATGAAAAAGLKPYTPYLFTVSFVMLVLGFWSVRNASRKCSLGAVPRSVMISKYVLWGSATIWFISAAFTLYSLRG
jgi:hypothetical protein